jgi:hypothetical protein
VSDEQTAAARNERFRVYWAARAAAAQAGEVGAAEVEAARTRNAQFRALADEIGAREAAPDTPRRRPYTPG